MTVSTTTYKWKEPSAIESMEVIRSVDGKRAIHLIARDGVTEGSLSRLPVDLHRFGITGAYADAPNGRTMLVIPNVRATDAQKVAGFLQSRSLATGEPTVNEVAGKSEEGWGEYLSRESLKLSGKFGLAGQAALGFAGLLAGDKNRQVAAGIGGSMEVMNSIFGNGRDNLDTDALVHQMAQYFKSQGIPIPDLQDDQVKDSLATSLKRFVGSNSFAITNGMGAYGCWKTGLSGYKEGNSSRVAVGTINGVGKAVALLVPEKNAEEKRLEREERAKQGKADEPRSPLSEFVHGAGGTLGTLVTNPTQFPASLKNLARNNPLAIDGALRVADNIFVFKDAAHQRLDINKNWADTTKRQGELEREVAALKDTKGGEAYDRFYSEIESRRQALDGKIKGIHNLEAEKKPKARFSILETIGWREPDPESLAVLQKESKQLAKKAESLKSLGSLDPSKRLAKAAELEHEITLLKSKSVVFKSGFKRNAALALPWVTASAWLISSSLSMISTKNSTTKPEDDPVFAKLYATTAKIINQLPPEERQAALQHMSDYFTTTPQLRELGVTTALFESLVKRRLSALEASPWTTKNVPPMPIAKESDGSWKSKIVDSAANSNHVASGAGVA